MKKDLIQIVKDNPGAVATIDNDEWVLSRKANPPKGFDNWTEEAQDKWRAENELACSEDDLKPLPGDTYQENNCYGGAILLACAAIAGIKVESV